jgi:hypothetical protein
MVEMGVQQLAFDSSTIGLPALLLLLTLLVYTPTSTCTQATELLF